MKLWLRNGDGREIPVVTAPDGSVSFRQMESALRRLGPVPPVEVVKRRGRHTEILRRFDPAWLDQERASSAVVRFRIGGNP